MSLQLLPGSRCLLIGANGAGKTTLLKILAGKHMVPREQVLVLGEPPVHSTELTTSGQLTYVGGNWTRDIAFAGTSIPLTVSQQQQQQEVQQEQEVQLAQHICSRWVDCFPQQLPGITCPCFSSACVEIGNISAPSATLV